MTAVSAFGVDWRGVGTRFMRFAAVGGAATVVQYLVLGVAVKLGLLPPPEASALGFAVSTLVNYFLNYKYTFGSSARHSVVMTRFVLNALVGLVWSFLLMSALAKYTQLHYFLSQILVTGFVLVWNFSVNSLWTFREAKPQEAADSND